MTASILVNQESDKSQVSRKKAIAGRGRNRIYAGEKKDRTITLTDESWEKLKAIAFSLDLSRSEVLEKLLRGESEVLQAIASYLEQNP